MGSSAMGIVKDVIAETRKKPSAKSMCDCVDVWVGVRMCECMYLYNYIIQ